MLTEYDRVLPGHLQAADRLLRRRQIHPAGQADPRSHRRRRHHRVPGLAGDRTAQQHLNPQPAAARPHPVLPPPPAPKPSPHARLPPPPPPPAATAAAALPPAGGAGGGPARPPPRRWPCWPAKGARSATSRSAATPPRC